MGEARHRWESCKRSGPKCSGYVAEVGCWCPWSPNPDDLAEAVGDQNAAQYSETALNTLMKKYQENVDERDQFYMDRTRALGSMGKKEASDPDAPPGASEARQGDSATASSDAADEGSSRVEGFGMPPDHEERRKIMADLEAEDGWSQAKLKPRA